MKGDFNLARHKVEITGVNTNEIVVLTSQETEELFKKYKNGDNQAKEKLVNDGYQKIDNDTRIHFSKQMTFQELFYPVRIH